MYLHHDVRQTVLRIRLGMIGQTRRYLKMQYFGTFLNFDSFLTYFCWCNLSHDINSTETHKLTYKCELVRSIIIPTTLLDVQHVELNLKHRLASHCIRKNLILVSKTTEIFVHIQMGPRVGLAISFTITSRITISFGKSYVKLSCKVLRALVRSNSPQGIGLASCNE